jgi:hypothetical protein
VSKRALLLLSLFNNRFKKKTEKTETDKKNLFIFIQPIQILIESNNQQIHQERLNIPNDQTNCYKYELHNKRLKEYKFQLLLNEINT